MFEIITPALMIGNAPVAATLNLAVQILLGLILLVGMLLARRGKFRAHGICQSLVMLLNLVAIALYMLPVFRRSVLPKFPGGVWNSAFYALPAMHAIVGTIAELLGLYIILRAGTELLPPALRFDDYKRWMRAALALWWISIALGIATYAVWHLADSAVPVQPAQPALASAPASATVTITMKNFAFEPKEITVAPGTTVVWKNVQGIHTIKTDLDGFESEIVPTNGEFSHKTGKEGRYSYYCTLHGAAGGRDMSGTVIVAAGAR